MTPCFKRQNSTQFSRRNYYEFSHCNDFSDYNHLTNLDLDNLFGGVIDIIIRIAMYVGIVLAAGGVFSLILAYLNDNPDQQARAVRVLVVGGALIGLRLLLQMAGIITQ